MTMQCFYWRKVFSSMSHVLCAPALRQLVFNRLKAYNKWFFFTNGSKPGFCCNKDNFFFAKTRGHAILRRKTRQLGASANISAFRNIIPMTQKPASFRIPLYGAMWRKQGMSCVFFLNYAWVITLINIKAHDFSESIDDAIVKVVKAKMNVIAPLERNGKQQIRHKNTGTIWWFGNGFKPPHK